MVTLKYIFSTIRNNASINVFVRRFYLDKYLVCTAFKRIMAVGEEEGRIISPLLIAA